MKNETITIDLEPKWGDLCNFAAGGILPASELMPACKMADLIRQAQKSGKKSIRFAFGDDGNITVED